MQHWWDRYQKTSYESVRSPFKVFKGIFAICCNDFDLLSSSQSFTTVLANGVFPQKSVPRTPTLCIRASIKETKMQMLKTINGVILGLDLFSFQLATFSLLSHL